MSNIVTVSDEAVTVEAEPLRLGGPPDMSAKPTTFHPHQAPGFVEIKLSAYKAPNGTPWWQTRPVIKPRLQLVHTNGARGEGSIESAINWGNAATANTKPHYQVDRHRAAKLVPTDRRAIGNGTVDSFQGGHGDVGEWSIVIETADEGYPSPGEDSGFIGEQIEMIAQILAYESICHGIPLTTPNEWFLPGTAAHTDPFGYPYWTIHQGKVCPGRTKKAQLRLLVIPRAKRIVTEWTTSPDPGDDDMPTADNRRLLDTRQLGGKVVPGQVITIDIGRAAVLASVNFTVTETEDAGFLVAWGGGPQPVTSNVNYDGAGQTRSNVAMVPLDVDTFHFTIAGTKPAHVIVDLQATFG